MDKSGTYAACEQMLQMPFMMMQLSQLDEILNRLETIGRLNSRERQRLLDFAINIWDIDQ
jgi:hypothetical protein